MPQPVKKSGPYQKPRSKTVKKKTTTSAATDKRLPTHVTKTKKVRHHPKYGTSKLEKKFAHEFLDKMGLKYQYQFEAVDIKRFYDFCIETDNGSKILLETDGDFFHSYGKEYDEMSPMQKHNKRVDKIKDEWASMHRYKLLRIWEHDIEKNPEKVRMMILEAIGEAEDKKNILENKKKRH